MKGEKIERLQTEDINTYWIGMKGKEQSYKTWTNETKNAVKNVWFGKC